MKGHSSLTKARVGHDRPALEPAAALYLSTSLTLPLGQAQSWEGVQTEEARMDLLEPPRVVERPQQDYLGIRVVTPFRGMLSTRNELINELDGWLNAHGIDDVGPFFLRLHVIDMSCPMDLEVGVVTPGPLTGDARVQSAVLPSGRYATLTYRNHSIRANRALIEWAAAQDIAFDRRDVAEGDLFACRYEAFRTDPRTEPRETKWEVELNFLVAEPAGSQG